MKRQTKRIKTKLAVIGSGIAGFAASMFAMRSGIEVAQFGHTGAIAYTTGYFDLLGVQDQKILTDPWAGVDKLRSDQPHHPLTRLSNGDIRAAFDYFTTSISEMGIGYTKPGDKNVMALLPYGVDKPTLSVPKTMVPGIEARKKNAKTLIIDFAGLQGFSAKEFQANIGSDWTGLSSARIQFPDMEDRQVFAEVMARALETPDAREKLAERIRPLVKEAEYIGLPAMLGMQDPAAVLGEMERLIGASLFEIPTIPPAVSGIRLRELFERELPKRGLVLEPQLKVHKAEMHKKGGILYLRGAMEDIEVEAEAVILTTGRFLSGGLCSNHQHLAETLFDLPIDQPKSRDDWYRKDYLDPRGHPINRAGVEIDASFRPVDKGAKLVSDRLFAAGAILAHQDWIRQRCGAGLAITSAYGAVSAVEELLA